MNMDPKKPGNVPPLAALPQPATDNPPLGCTNLNDRAEIQALGRNTAARSLEKYPMRA